MSHLPFETWILDPKEMTQEDRRALREHLATCSQCQRLQSRWSAVSLELRARRTVGPAPGFTERWKASLAERRLREQRRQAWRIFGVLTGASLVILTVLAGYMMATSTPADWLVAIVRAGASSMRLFNLVYYVVQTWLSATPLVFNLAVWIYLTVILCLLSLVWVGVFWWTKAGKNVGVLDQ